MTDFRLNAKALKPQSPPPPKPKAPETAPKEPPSAASRVGAAARDTLEAAVEQAWAWDEEHAELPVPPLEAAGVLEGMGASAAELAELAADPEQAAELAYQASVSTFTEADADRNGYLGSDEVADQAAFALMDTNADGKVGLDEYLAEGQARAEAEAALAEHDTDENGYLSSDEVADQGAFQAMDADGDGRVTATELRAGQAQPADEAAAEPAEAGQPQASYRTAYPHSASELASQLGFGSVEEMAAANPQLGAISPDTPVPAETTIYAPADNPTVNAAMQTHDASNGGGRYEQTATVPAADAQPTSTTQPGADPAATPDPGTPLNLQDPNSFYMKQVYDPKWNPDGPMTSANCGPTSLAMALKGLGLQPPGLSNPDSPEAWIDATRMAMTGNTDDHAYTDTSQVIAAAQASGATAEHVTFGGIDQALAEGKMVVASGNPAAYNGDWQERGLANSEYDGGHFILVTGKDADGNYMISDPLSNVGSVAVTPAQLESYMAYQGWNSGVAIGNPNA